MPQVSGPMKEAMAPWPGCRKRSNLWTLLGVLPAWEKSCVHVSVCLSFGTDGSYRIDDHAAGTALNDNLGLGLDGVAVVATKQDAVVARCALVLVPEQREHGDRS